MASLLRDLDRAAELRFPGLFDLSAQQTVRVALATALLLQLMALVVVFSSVPSAAAVPVGGSIGILAGAVWRSRPAAPART